MTYLRDDQLCEILYCIKKIQLIIIFQSSSSALSISEMSNRLFNPLQLINFIYSFNFIISHYFITSTVLISQFQID